MTNRELEILNILKEDPMISQDELAAMLGISRSGVATHIHNLMKKGYIKGKGYVLSERNFVTVVGGINIDIIGIPDGELIDNNSNPGKIHFTIGGAARNIALSLKQLSIPSYLISVYGDDMNGEKFVNDSNKKDLDIQYCERINGQRTSSFLYIDDVSRTKTMGIDDMGIFDNMTPDFMTRYIKLINQSEYCIADTNLPSESLEYLYKNVTAPIIIKTTSINKNSRLISPYQNIHTLITSSLELKELLASYGEPYSGLEQAARFILGKNVSNIIVFSIKEGLLFINTSTKFRLNAIPCEVVNTSGTSAVFISTVVWGLHNNLDWDQILKFAYSAAVLSVKSREPVSPLLSTTELMAEEKRLFKK
ncbi:PfkB family carbohydrate kinase [Alkalibacterium kapii]|uniref:Kinase n=1 Tax=Alkalibacterium kapii TaxID=426704 RepID=A0A511ASQ0_9LACT|nr:PfkB family carbohydrate kinase [Alkalibacterium kapii]GEK90762.1 kinase [Alkalibacterium kapii]